MIVRASAFRSLCTQLQQLYTSHYTEFIAYYNCAPYALYVCKGRFAHKALCPVYCMQGGSAPGFTSTDFQDNRVVFSEWNRNCSFCDVYEWADTRGGYPTLVSATSSRRTLLYRIQNRTRPHGLFLLQKIFDSVGKLDFSDFQRQRGTRCTHINRKTCGNAKIIYLGLRGGLRNSQTSRRGDGPVTGGSSIFRRSQRISQTVLVSSSVSNYQELSDYRSDCCIDSLPHYVFKNIYVTQSNERTIRACDIEIE